jgi:hypothetical protein
MKLRSPAGLAAGLLAAALLAAPAAVAAGPATVKLRIEGADRTIFEGVVTTDARSITMGPGPDFVGTYPGGTHVCNGLNQGNQGGYPGPGATPTTALDDAARAGGFGWYGPFSSSQDDFFVTTIGGEGTINGPYWDVRTNYVSNARGGCQIELTNGDDVLYALDGFAKAHALKLSGPATAAPGVPFAVSVTDGQTGEKMDGATVAGQVTVGGTATVRLDSTGPHRLKATRADSVRSNALDVCVTSGSDGACGSTVPRPSAPDTTAPTATILGIRHGQRFARRRAPRELRGTVTADPSGLWAVKIRLTRRFNGTCWYFSGSKERLLERTCGKQYAFKVGEATDWSYLLPGRLPRGRYVLSAYAVDKAFNRGTETRVVFRVR